MYYTCYFFSKDNRIEANQSYALLVKIFTNMRNTLRFFKVKS